MAQVHYWCAENFHTSLIVLWWSFSYVLPLGLALGVLVLSACCSATTVAPLELKTLLQSGVYEVERGAKLWQRLIVIPHPKTS